MNPAPAGAVRLMRGIGSVAGGVWPARRRDFLVGAAGSGSLAEARSSTSAQRPCGSASTRTALHISVSGMARIAPSGPSSHAQNTKATNVTVTDSPTASPMKRGWMIDYTTTLSAQQTMMTITISCGPPVSNPSSAGGTTPTMNPTFGI